MNRNGILAAFVMLGLALWMPACKPEPDSGPADGLPDSLFISTPLTIQKPFRFADIPIPADNPMTEEGVQLGRMLFWDPIVSNDSSLACASCHTPEFNFTDHNKALSRNFTGALTKRNAPPVINLAWHARLFWDGRARSLEELAKDALLNEQGFGPQYISRLEKREDYVRLFRKAFGRPGNITEDKAAKALAQFMRTMISSESKFDRYMRGQESLSPEEMNGFQIFSTERGDCFHCHTDGPFLTFTNRTFHNNALDSALNINDFRDAGFGGVTGNPDDYGKFKSPTLRNIEFSAPYMHDGRYSTLEQVINFYSDSLRNSPTVDPNMKKINLGGLQLSAQEKSDLIAFLKTLSDTTFMNNPKFSDPFR